MYQYTRTALRDGDLGHNGPYEAMVVSHLDRYYQGTLLVEILRHYGSSNVARRSGQLIAVKYVSPFYGATPYLGLNENDGFQNTQKSYGFWAVPPDFGTRVLVIFAESSGPYGYWIGCIQDSNMNFMVPGGPGVSTVLTTDVTPENLVGKKLPVGEYNKLIETGEATDPTLFKKPYNKDFTEVLEVQGLINDEARGTTTTSARRETPSMVFGMSTPGPLDKRVGHPTAPYGATGEEAQIPFNRLGGSSFVMDDGDDKFVRATHAEDGPPIYVNREIGETGGDETIPQNELIRLRTRTGHQILMHNSEDLIYIANSRGTAWLEFTSDGKIDIYANDSISLHTDNDFNLSAERDINMEAGRNVNINASSRWSDYQPVEQGNNSGVVRIEGTNESHIYSNESIVFETRQNFEIKSGNDIVLTATSNMHFKSGSHTFQEATGSIHQRAGHSIYRYSDSNINDRATGLLMQTADGAIHRTSTGSNIYDNAATQHHTNAGAEILRTSGASINDRSGSSIFTTAAASIQTRAGADLIQQAATIQNNSAGELILQSGGQMSLASGGEIALEASGKLSLASSSVHASANLFVGGNIETPNNLYSNQSIALDGHLAGRPGAIPSLSGPDSAADAVAALSAAGAITASEAASANESGGVSPDLRSHTLPKVIPGTGEIITFTTSIPRVPQHEPWPHHENLNPLAFKKHETDLEALGRLPTADRILTPDTFAKGQAGITTSIRIGGTGGNITTGSEGSYGNDPETRLPDGSAGIAPTVGAGPVPESVAAVPRVSSDPTYVPGTRLPENIESMDPSYPRQPILDMLSIAASIVIPNGKLLITPKGGAARPVPVTDRSNNGPTTRIGPLAKSPNHHPGYAADFHIKINGTIYYVGNHKDLYQRLAEELIRNANSRGVRPGVAAYETFMHYDETPSRSTGSVALGSHVRWYENGAINSDIVKNASENVARNRRHTLDDATVRRTGINQSGYEGDGTPSRNPGTGDGPSVDDNPGLTPEKRQAITALANRLGASPCAMIGLLGIESAYGYSPQIGSRSSGNPPSGGRYYGIFQLQGTQVAGLTQRVLGSALTPDQYLRVSFEDQLRVYEQYIRDAEPNPTTFFNGDPVQDAARLWKLQLAPGSPRSLDYTNLNTVVFDPYSPRFRNPAFQADIISRSSDRRVTVESASTGTLRVGGCNR